MPLNEVVIEKKEISALLKRITEEILEKNKSVEDIVVIGVRARGDILAERLVKNIKTTTGVEVPLGVLDITLYRDDFGNIEAPIIQKTDINFDVAGKIVILVDDVLCTGRTTRAALDAIIDFGRPCRIELMVLVNRDHRELPIQADYVGIKLETNLTDKVNVKLEEIDKEDSVEIKKQ
jgi:pyrimidine operon attenuation protein / uracil phosphoribosyltransferase